MGVRRNSGARHARLCVRSAAADRGNVAVAPLSIDDLTRNVGWSVTRARRPGFDEEQVMNIAANVGPNSAALVLPDRVRSSMYTDPAMFETEMARIFEQTWVWVAHASEIAEPGAFKMA